jgi:superfamily I DNA/RNA helicase
MQQKMVYNNIVLTTEQNHALSLARTGDDLKIEAFAGSGKTFLLGAIADSLRQQGKRGLYVAFNKAIATEAASKFPENVACRTAHSLAFGAVGRHYKARLQKINGGMIARYLNLRSSQTLLNEVAVGNMVLDTIRKFCFSADKIIKASHVPFVDVDEDSETTPEEIKQLRVKIAGHTREIWQKMIDPNQNMPITHDVYLKLWSLNNPSLNYDFILFDEAQDANAVMLDIIGQQKRAQKIYVGDRYQQIYSWRGAVNAMDTIQTKNTCCVSQSFRFGQGVADKANEILNTYLEPATPIHIKGNQNTRSVLNKIPWPDAIICRTNGQVIAQTIANLAEHRVYIAGGVAELTRMLKGAEDLKAGKKTQVAELALFEDWESVKEFAETKTGGDLKSFVNMVEQYGTKKLSFILYQTSKSSQDADITITTAHKAKGLEWDRVKLGPDFKFPKDDAKKPMNPEEVNALYVATTRALRQLDITDCKAANPLDLPYFKNKGDHNHSATPQYSLSM